MSKLSAQVALKDLVEEYFLKSKLPRIEYANIKQIAIRGYQELIFQILPNGRIVDKFTMDSYDMLSMPDDLVELNAVYIATDNGEMWPLSKNRNIIRTTSDDGTTRNPESPYYEGVSVNHPGGDWYSATGGVNILGYYIDDFVNRRILFVNTGQSEVILDYVSTGIEDVESAYVPVKAVGAMNAYIAYNYHGFNAETPLNRLNFYAERLKREKQTLRNMQFNFEDFYQSVLKTLSGSIQR